MLKFFHATSFSFIPPIANTSPWVDTYPVNAISFCSYYFYINDTNDTNIANPADGPSFGILNFGVWKWKILFLIYVETLDYPFINSSTRLSHTFTLYLNTSPKLPVITI